MTAGAERTCRTCSKETVIGHDIGEQWDVEPARYLLRAIEREQSKVTTVGKYCDHLPLYRQSAIPEREAGLGCHDAAATNISTIALAV